MLDVRTRTGKSRVEEYILIHFGRLTEVNVLDVDRKQQQIVLRAYEPASCVEQLVWDRRLRDFRTEEHVVPESTRRLLVGMDERHLFACPLGKNASSVREAHRKLMPVAARVKRQKGAKRDKRTKRQGEWFFVPVDSTQVLEKIQRTVDLVGAERRQPIQRLIAGRPHIVDERVQVGDAIYVRGRVRHPDHSVLKLNGWHEVHLNTENRSARIEGMSWVD